MAAVTQTRNSQTNGLLPVAATQTYGNGTPRQAAARPPSQKLKVLVRRLAPSLTEEEFMTILGGEWKVGQGKVDWFQYTPGKLSREYDTPSNTSPMLIMVAHRSLQDPHEHTFTLRTSPTL